MDIKLLTKAERDEFELNRLKSCDAAWVACFNQLLKSGLVGEKGTGIDVAIEEIKRLQRQDVAGHYPEGV